MNTELRIGPFRHSATGALRSVLGAVAALSVAFSASCCAAPERPSVARNRPSKVAAAWISEATILGLRVDKSLWVQGRPRRHSLETLTRGATDITAVEFSRQFVSEKDLEMVGRLHEVRGVSLDHCRFSDRSLQGLAGLPKLKVVDLSSTMVGRDGLKALAASRSIEVLGLTAVYLGESEFRALAKFPRLRKLVIHCDNLNDRNVRYLRLLPHLRELDVAITFVTAKGLEEISKLRKLRSLECGPVGSEEGVRWLERLDGLEELTLYVRSSEEDLWQTLGSMGHLKRLILYLPTAESCAAPRARDFSGLGQLQHLKVSVRGPRGERRDESEMLAMDAVHVLGGLRSLELSGCRFENRAKWPGCSRMKHLRQVHLKQCGGDLNSLVASMAELNKLESLVLEDGNSVTGEGWGDLSGMASLEHLWIHPRGRLSDGAVRSLATLPKLRSLSLAGARRLKGKDWGDMSAMKALEELDLSVCKQLTDGVIKSIATLPRLRWVELDNCDGLSGVGWDLSGMEKLAGVDLNHCEALTNDGVSALKAVPNLQYVDLNGCRKITDDAIYALLRVHPQCFVTGPSRWREMLPEYYEAQSE